jgi:hypothetical protein
MPWRFLKIATLFTIYRETIYPEINHSADIISENNMQDKKYQVFISSTYKDLVEERRDIARAVLDLGHIPAAMEYFPAMDEEQLDYIKRIIDECDYYIIVIAGKYGSTDEGGISYTEREYDYAKEQKKTVLGFPIFDPNKLPREQTETETSSIEKLEKFRSKLMEGRLIKTWQDRRDLEIAVIKALPAAFQRYPQTGWVRTPKQSSENYLEEINDLRKENEKLLLKLNTLSTKAIPTIDNLAGLDDKFDFHVETRSLYDASLGRGRYSASKSWHEIVLAFSQALRVPLSRDALKAQVSEIFAKSIIFQGNEVPSHLATVMDETPFETMVVQLQALGYVSENKAFKYESTPQAKSLYILSTVVRKT